MANGNADDDMKKWPSRTVEVTLDTESEAFLVEAEADEPEFPFFWVHRRFRKHFKPAIETELKAKPGSKLLKYVARLVSGLIKLLRRTS